MILRTLPFLQIEPGCFGEAWLDKWHVLDQSFRESVEAIITPTRHVIAAVSRMIEAKFSFTPEHTPYSEQ